jgi:hypothetical protein
MLENIKAMDQRRPPEYIIEVFADPSSVKDVVRGMFVMSQSDPALLYRFILPRKTKMSEKLTHDEQEFFTRFFSIDSFHL